MSGAPLPVGAPVTRRSSHPIVTPLRTRSSSAVTLARPSVSSSLEIIYPSVPSFTLASPYLWNQLPSSFRQPHSVHSPLGSPHPANITSSQSPSLLSPSITPSTFHSRLKNPSISQIFSSIVFLDCLHASGLGLN